MKQHTIIATLATGAMLTGCASSDKSMEKMMDGPDAVIASIEKAHHQDDWYSHAAFLSDIHIRFGGKDRIIGTMTTTPSMSGTRIDHDNGKSVIWDGQTAWVSPSDASMSGARFDILTWPYFLAAPIKLDDPGTNHAFTGKSMVDGKVYDDTVKLTFDSGVGDAPDDWYIIYKNPETDYLDALAYIVSFGKDAEGIAKSEPHAIIYEDYRMVDGIPIPHEWTFRLWSEELGVHGDVLGTASLSNARFVDSLPSDTFLKPMDASEATMPN